MLLSAVSVLVVVQTSSEIPEGLMNNSVECSVSSDVKLYGNRIVGKKVSKCHPCTGTEALYRPYGP